MDEGVALSVIAAAHWAHLEAQRAARAAAVEVAVHQLAVAAGWQPPAGYGTVLHTDARADEATDIATIKKYTAIILYIMHIQYLVVVTFI